MFDTGRFRASAGGASVFIVPSETGGASLDLWAEAGRAIELASREPAPIGYTVRVAVVVALVVGAKLCLAGAL